MLAYKHAIIAAIKSVKIEQRRAVRTCPLQLHVMLRRIRKNQMW